MEVEIAELDELQAAYKAVVEEWIVAIRREEALASVNHTVAELDQWERAHFDEDAARNKVLAAKRRYIRGRATSQILRLLGDGIVSMGSLLVTAFADRINRAICRRRPTPAASRVATTWPGGRVPCLRTASRRELQ